MSTASDWWKPAESEILEFKCTSCSWVFLIKTSPCPRNRNTHLGLIHNVSPFFFSFVFTAFYRCKKIWLVCLIICELGKSSYPKGFSSVFKERDLSTQPCGTPVSKSFRFPFFFVAHCWRINHVCHHIHELTDCCILGGKTFFSPACGRLYNHQCVQQNSKNV